MGALKVELMGGNSVERTEFDLADLMVAQKDVLTVEGMVLQWAVLMVELMGGNSVERMEFHLADRMVA